MIAIIAILAAILFPVFAKAREKARQASCLSNVKQITAGVLMYAGDHDELSPPNAARCASHGPWGGSQVVQCFPYIKSSQLYICPAAKPPPFSADCVPAASRALVPGSSYNISCGLDGYSYDGVAGLGSVACPAEVFMIGETASGHFWRPATDRGQCGAGTHAPHNGGLNVSFVDGHAKHLQSHKVHSSRANVSPRWAPEYLPWSAVAEAYAPGY